MKTCAACGRNENETRFCPSQKYVCQECNKVREHLSRERANEIKRKRMKNKKCGCCGLTDKETKFYANMNKVCCSCYMKRAAENRTNEEENQFAREWNRQHPYKFDMLHRFIQKLAFNAQKGDIKK